MIRPYLETYPQIDDSAFIAETAQIVGRVEIGANSSVWYGAVVRADVDIVRIGRNCNIQDGALIHQDAGQPALIGDNVTIGHGAILHGCLVEDNCLIGMGAIVLNGARLGRGSVVAAGAVVPPGMQVPPLSQVGGVPAKLMHSLAPESEQQRLEHADSYRRLAADYR